MVRQSFEQQATEKAVSVAVAAGDGIGPEITAAVLQILDAAGAAISPVSIEVGHALYARGNTSGIDPSAYDTLRRTGVLLKGPITTPQGGGVKSLNVTLRKTLGLFANVRPVRAFHPFIATNAPGMDVVIVRENEEDTYAGIEHRQTDEVYQCLKLITRPGCERIARYAFEYAVRNGRKKVSCFSKDNIMKLTDGLFHKVFDEIGREYPQIEKDHWIIDIGAARLASKPTYFDVIVAPNLYGDIISDIAAEVAGSVGLAGSANIGNSVSMFEAVHGSAPDIAGKDIANPSGLLQAAIMMLVHIGQADVAARVQNAWLRTIEDGVHTRDIASSESTRKTVGTRDFTAAVIERIGEQPRHLTVVEFSSTADSSKSIVPVISKTVPAKKTLAGVDVFVHWNDAGRSPDELAQQLSPHVPGALTLKMITNRGVKVWPAGAPETFCTDHWRCRFVAREGDAKHADIVQLLHLLQSAGFDFIKTENLYKFDGAIGYSLGQGE